MSLQKVKIRLRPFRQEDVNQTYADWFKEVRIREFIDYARQPKSINDLTNYVKSMDSDKKIHFDKILLELEGGELCWIGTIKATLLDSRTAEIGIMIGNTKYRGLGIGVISIEQSIKKLRQLYSNLQTITAGVSKSNIASVKLFKRTGFKIYKCKEKSFRLSDGTLDDELTFVKSIG